MIKSITLDNLVQRHGSWLETGIDEGPVISSRVRLARNLDAYHFPSWAPENQKHAIWNQSYALFSAIDKTYMCWEMGVMLKYATPYDSVIALHAALKPSSSVLICA